MSGIQNLSKSKFIHPDSILFNLAGTFDAAGPAGEKRRRDGLPLNSLGPSPSIGSDQAASSRPRSPAPSEFSKYISEALLQMPALPTSEVESALDDIKKNEPDFYAWASKIQPGQIAHAILNGTATWDDIRAHPDEVWSMFVNIPATIVNMLNLSPEASQRIAANPMALRNAFEVELAAATAAQVLGQSAFLPEAPGLAAQSEPSKRSELSDAEKRMIESRMIESLYKQARTALQVIRDREMAANRLKGDRSSAPPRGRNAPSVASKEEEFRLKQKWWEIYDLGRKGLTAHVISEQFGFDKKTVDGVLEQAGLIDPSSCAILEVSTPEKDKSVENWEKREIYKLCRKNMKSFEISRRIGRDETTVIKILSQARCPPTPPKT